MISSIRIVEDFVANRGVISMTRDDIHRSWQCKKLGLDSGNQLIKIASAIKGGNRTPICTANRALEEDISTADEIDIREVIADAARRMARNTDTLDFQIAFKEFILIVNENVRRRKLEGKSTKSKVVQLLRELVP